MTASTVTLTPDTIPVPGVGAIAETPHPSVPGEPASAELLYRAADPYYRRWLAHVMPAAACSRPIRLKVDAEWTNPDSRPVGRPERVTDDMPDHALYVACKNRRATECPACAETYRADMYHLVKTGLVGGKGVPESVAQHPCLFVTFSAPSFGPVHSVSKPGRPRPCRPRRIPQTCPHGIRLACWDVHGPDDPMAGEPFCLDCYDYNAQAVWNLHAGELWRRTMITATRRLVELTKPLGIRVRISYTKIAEYQHRGVIHFHALLRLDGVNRGDPTAILAPDPAITAHHLQAAIDAAADTSFTTAPHPRRPAGWVITWGSQLDIRTVRLSSVDLDETGHITHTAVAGYLAKYATKATEQAGHVSRRLSEESLPFYTERDTHQARQLLACWYLGQRPLGHTTPAQREQWFHGSGTLPGWGKLAHWAHMLGYGGHFATKTRRYSVTLTALRAARKDFQRRQQSETPEWTVTGHDNQSAEDVSPVNLTYLIDGIGWRTRGDALLANTAAAMARERRQAAREAMEEMIGG